MRNLLLCAFLMLLSMQLFCVYEIGDVVEDFSWLESDGGEPVERNLYETIDQGKVVLLFFGGLG
ncbi:hypothetical protein ACFLYK_04530 [Candidatus Cloacimonadota bacterium]